MIARHRSTVAHSSSFAGATAAKGGQFYADPHSHIWRLLLPGVVSTRQRIREMTMTGPATLAFSSSVHWDGFCGSGNGDLRNVSDLR